MSRVMADYYGPVLDDPDLDPGIKPVVACLLLNGFQTTSSCEGHGFRIPYVTFLGDEQEGPRAIKVLAGWSPIYLERLWVVEKDGSLLGPCWRVSFSTGNWRVTSRDDRRVVIERPRP